MFRVHAIYYTFTEIITIYGLNLQGFLCPPLKVGDVKIFLYKDEFRFTYTWNMVQGYNIMISPHLQIFCSAVPYTSCLNKHKKGGMFTHMCTSGHWYSQECVCTVERNTIDNR